MSLHELAHHVQKAGRGEDTVLIHMTPKEVQGLQALAMKHGGSLTINPETGLPEANFLKSILPMVAGLALGPAGFALMSAPMAGLAVGAATGLATGSLEKGLMAGLGAFGGASLGGALSATGAAGAASAAGTGAAGTSTLGNIASAPLNLSTPFSTLPAAATPAATTASTLNGSIMGSAPNALSSVVRVPTLNAAQQMAPMTSWDKMAAGAKSAFSDPVAFAKANPWQTAGLGLTLANAFQPEFKTPKEDKGMIRPYEFSRTQNMEAYDQGNPIYAQDPGSSREQNYFTDQYTALKPYAAPGPEYKAEGGLAGLNAFAVGGPVEEMAAQNAMGQNTGYPMANLETSMYTNPQMSRPTAGNVIGASVDAGVDPYTGEARFAKGGTTGGYKYDYDPQTQQFTQISAPSSTNSYGLGVLGQIFNTIKERSNQQPAQQPTTTGGIAPVAQPQQQPMYQQQAAAPMPAYQSPEQQLGLGGFYGDMDQQLAGMRFADGGSAGEYNLGDYSDGGRLLRGPGDGVSDSVPAVIGNRQPARLADGEFVIPARIVSELGNGSTDAGARRLYAMMDRVQKARKKSIGKGKVAVNSKAEKLLPA
jgi:hypothetical protein